MHVWCAGSFYHNSCPFSKMANSRNLVWEFLQKRPTVIAVWLSSWVYCGTVIPFGIACFRCRAVVLASQGIQGFSTCYWPLPSTDTSWVLSTVTNRLIPNPSGKCAPVFLEEGLQARNNQSKTNLNMILLYNVMWLRLSICVQQPLALHCMNTTDWSIKKASIFPQPKPIPSSSRIRSPVMELGFPSWYNL